MIISKSLFRDSLQNLRILPFLFSTILVSTCVFSACNNKLNTENREMAFADSIAINCNENVYIDPEQSLVKFNDAQKNISDSNAYYFIELNKILCYYSLKQKENAAITYNNIIRYCHSHKGCNKIEAVTYLKHAILFHAKEIFDSATIYYNKAIDLMNNEPKCARYSLECMINLADIMKQSGKLPESLKCYNHALSLADSTNEHSFILSINSGIATIYTELGDYTNAEKSFCNAAKSTDGHDEYDKFFLYSSYGNCCYFQDKFNEALKLYRKAKVSAIEMKQPAYTALCDINIGGTLMQLNQLDSASFYILKCKPTFELYPYSQKFYTYSLLGELETKKGNFGKAAKYLSMAIDTSAISPHYLELHYGRLKDLAIKTHDYKKALVYQDSSQIYNDKLSNQQYRDKITKLSYDYAQDTTILHKNLQIAQQEQKVSKLTNYFYIVIGLIILAVSIITVWVLYKKKQHIIQENKARESLYSLRMANIRNRISPHFFFNVLNREIDVKNEGMNNLVRLLRKTLELCDKYEVSLNEEIRFIENYIDTEKDSLGDNFTYDCKISSDIDADNFIIPSMMLHIFVENAVKHGLRGFNGDKRLLLSATKDGNNTILKVENNGNQPRKMKSNTGLGLKIVTQTIQILNEKNRNKIMLKYGATQDSDGNFIWSVTITIPDNYNFNLSSIK